MKNFIFPILCFCCLIVLFSCHKDDPPVVENPEINPVLNDIFDINKVQNISFLISTSEWNRLLTNFDSNPYNEEYILAECTINDGSSDTRLDSIGIRIRGNTSRRRPEGNFGELHNTSEPDWHHAHFALSFRKYNKMQRYRKLERMNLKWFKDDANYVREVYCYDLFERFNVWTAPQSSYCRLTIKIKEDPQEAYYGVYQMIENVDEDFLANRSELFASAYGNLWKCSWGADLHSDQPDKMGVEDITLDPSTMKTYTYDLKTNKGNVEVVKTQLAKFINDFNAKSGVVFQTWAEEHIDIPLLLRTYAVNVMVGMWDDYWANNNNYYIYFDGDGKFYFIPFDYDNTLGTSLMMDSGRQDLLRWGPDNRPLIHKIITIPEFKKLYISYLYELAHPNNDYFFISRSLDRIQKWQAMIEPFVNNDTNEDMEIGDQPASWGNQPQYRLHSQTDNFFDVRGAHLPSLE